MSPARARAGEPAVSSTTRDALKYVYAEQR